MAKRRLVYLPLAEIAPADVNPKDHDDGALDESLDEFGYIDPILLDERTGQIVGGHGRRDRLIEREAAGGELPDGIVLSKGVWTAPVVVGWRSRDDAHAIAAGIALNRVGERGGWKRDILVETLAELREQDQLPGTGFDDIDLDRTEAEAAAARYGALCLRRLPGQLHEGDV
jgi:hypothetical protein